MSVRPVAFDPSGGVVVWHDEGTHGGTVPLADVAFARDPDGSVDPDVLVLPCPVAGCGAVSLHPVGGGAGGARVQLLFWRTVRRRAAALGIPANQRTAAAVKARIKARVEATDGPGRWRLEALADEDGDVPD